MSKEIVANHSNLLEISMQYFAEEEDSTTNATEPTAEQPAEQTAEATEQANEHPVEQPNADTESEQQASTTEPETIELKHNGEVKRVSRDELISLAQKGLDYDRIRPAHDFVKELAEKSGQHDVSAYMRMARDTMAKPTLSSEEEKALEAEREQLYTQYTDQITGELTPLAKAFADMQIQHKRESLLNQKQAKAQEEQAKTLEAWDKIARSNPDYIKDGQIAIPEDVVNGVAKIQAETGQDIYTSYMHYSSQQQIKQLKQEIAKLTAEKEATQANEAAKKASPGSLGGEPANDNDYVSSEEWDTLPYSKKRKLIENGKIYDFMKRWYKGDKT